MIILNQPSETMWFCVWTTKWQLWKLIFFTKNIDIFVRNIRILLNMILIFCPFLFTCPFLYLPWSITTCLYASLDRCFWNYLAKLTSDVRVPVRIITFVTHCDFFLEVSNDLASSPPNKVWALGAATLWLFKRLSIVIT